MEDQRVKKGTVAQKFNVTAEESRHDADKHGTSHKTAQLKLRDKESLQSKVNESSCLMMSGDVWLAKLLFRCR